MFDGRSLDPHTVLGIPLDADLDQIRDAYRRQTKKHHPDHGGDEWAFRIVVAAYESLTARRLNTGTIAPSPEGGSIVPDDLGAETGPVHDWAAECERVRPGVKDRDYPIERMVKVEVLWFRTEVADIYALLERREPSNFSGSLHLIWPDPEAGIVEPVDPVDLHAILGGLMAVFDLARARPEVQNARSRSAPGHFEAWLSFSSGRRAWETFTAIRPELNARGFGVRQLTRELTIPRDPDSS